MNIEYANTITITTLLSKLGLTPVTSKEGVLGYYSPLSPEPRLSLFINEATNEWIDHDLGSSGNALDFACAHLAAQGESHTISDGLRWLKNMMGYIPRIAPELLAQFADKKDDKTTLKLRAVTRMRKIELVQYLRTQGISIDLAKLHLKQVLLHDKATKKSFYTLGFKNEDKGWYLRNENTIACLRPKASSFIRGSIPKPDAVHIFKSIFDYLSYLTHKDLKILEEDSIILNSYCYLPDAAAYIKNYGYQLAYTWMDNDDLGKLATAELAKFFASEENLKHKKQNDLYAPHKDVATWHRHNCGLYDNPRILVSKSEQTNS